MNEEIKAQLSALVDDEFDPRQGRALLDRILREPDLRDAAGRYFLIGEAIRAKLPARPNRDLHRRVSAAVANEPTPLGRKKAPRLRLRPVAGLALAATIAAVAVLVGLNLTRPEVAPATARIAPAATDVAERRPWNAQEPAVEGRLKNYLVNHSEYIGRGFQGLLPYARVVAYDASR